MLTVSVLVRQPLVLGILVVEGVGPHEALLLPEVLEGPLTLRTAAQLKLIGRAQTSAATVGRAKKREAI